MTPITSIYRALMGLAPGLYSRVKPCLIFLLLFLTCRYSHVSPLELDKFLEDVK